MKNICVYCASSPGFEDVYMKAAETTGHFLAANGYRLVYGGGSVGLMGQVADACIAKGGEVIGVIPHFLNTREVGHKGLTELIAVESMHERKLKMSELADAFIALPGGFGTLEELAEILTWAQLGLVEKPIGILNVNGYYDHLIALLDNMVSQGLLKQENRDMLLVDTTIDALIDQFVNYKPIPVKKWLNMEGT